MQQLCGINRRNALTLGAAASFAWGTGISRAAAVAPVVVELFTSQGCNSCPPADALLTELVQEEGVVALTYHVDYWDYLGWKDTLGSPENSQRQYDYAHARGDMDVYTPQMIVNGRDHFVGSDRAAVRRAIDAARGALQGPEISMAVVDKEIRITLGEGAPQEATLWVMPIIPVISVKVLKGELAGSEIEYHNVVHQQVPAGMWDGTAKTVGLPKDGVLFHCCKGCVALLQSKKVGAVLSTAMWMESGA